MFKNKIYNLLFAVIIAASGAFFGFNFNISEANARNFSTPTCENMGCVYDQGPAECEEKQGFHSCKVIDSTCYMSLCRDSNPGEG